MSRTLEGFRESLAAVEAIREEGLERSQIAELTGYLTDVIGTRLTGSPAMLTSRA